ncbi:MAG: histidine kinase N-terminal 7TM domain-containing protein [Bacteroidales bacterium]
MLYDFSRISLLFHLTALTAILFGIVIYKRKPAPGSIYLVLFEFSVAIWSIGVAMQIASVSEKTRYAWAMFSYIGAAIGPVVYLLFTIDFVRIKSRIKPVHVMLLSSYSLVFIFFTFTNHYHHLIWKEIIVTPRTHLTLFTFGELFWVFLGVGYIYLFTGVILLVMAISRVPHLYKFQIVILLFASLVSIAGNLSYITNINPIPGLDWTPIAFTLAGMMIVVGVTKFRMFDLVPVAHRQIFDSIIDPVVLLDQNDLVLDGNPAFRKEFNLNKNKLNRPVRDFISTPECIELTHDEKPFEYKKTTGAEKKYFDVYVTRFHDKKRKVIGKLVVLRDITPRRKIEKSLIFTNNLLKNEIQEKEKLISDLKTFAHSVAHDLKNPVSNVIYLQQLIQDKLQDNIPDEVKGYLETLSYTSLSMNHIIDELLLLATIRYQEIIMDDVNMKDAVNDAIKRLEIKIKDSNCTITKPDNFPVIRGYLPWLTQVWENLISNSIKYSGTPPIIEIGHESIGDFIKFWIRDNGNGIPDEVSQQLSQGSFPVKRASEGHGLGLSIVKQIIDTLKGEIYITNGMENGTGCIFSFALPLQSKVPVRKQVS